MVFPMVFPMGLPTINLAIEKNHHFPMVFLWFSYGFRMVFEWFSNGITNLAIKQRWVFTR